MSVTLEVADLSLAAGSKALINALHLAIRAPRTVAVLGVNGAGKSTLLECMAHVRELAPGKVRVNGTDLALCPGRERAACVGLMPQVVDAGFEQPVIERVALGRYRAGGLWQWQDADDRLAANEALRAAGLLDLAQRLTSQLSGGERQRMGLAMLLAQDPDVLLLDEPFSALDPAHRARVAGVLDARRNAGRIVVFSVHDPNIAAAVADDVLLLAADGQWEFGPADTLLTEARLSALYNAAIRRIESADGRHAFACDLN